MARGAQGGWGEGGNEGREVMATNLENTMNIFRLPVHPAANLFPMLDKEEMENLVEDIKENGLREPLVIGEHEGKTVLVDGRNRRDACKKAGLTDVECVELNGEDPGAFIISANIMRRHLTKGQQAILWAMVKPEGTPGKKTSLVKPKGFPSDDTLSRARTVNREAPDLAKAVLAGASGLPQAYDETRARQKEADGDTSRMDKLKAERPDLGELVSMGKLSLPAAVAGAAEDARKKKENRLAELNAFKGVLWASKFNYKVQRDGFLNEFVMEELNGVMDMDTKDFKNALGSCVKAINKLLEEWN